MENMKDKLLSYLNRLKETWSSFQTRSKWMIAGSFFISLAVLAVLVYFVSKPSFGPLYSNLTPAEAGEIKTAIETRGIPVEVSPDGTVISVPEEYASGLKVSLAAEGIPKSGNVDYSIFSENLGLGMTDKQFDVVERDAMQNELAYLIEQVQGINQAKVMITLPKESVWLTDNEQVASASIVLTTNPGLQLNQQQINGLYHLVGKSVPNLPEEEIVIMNQNGQTFDIGNDSQIDNALTTYQQQRDIQSNIEKDIQSELQQMLGFILGGDKVIVSVITSIDFTKEKREENLVEPVDKDSNEGLAVSIERIQESFSGEGSAVNTAAGTGETDIANYPAVDGEGGNTEFEKVEERINNEVNRIYRQIDESPFVIDDITINVGVEPPVPDDPASLTPQNVNDIKAVLKNVVRTSLSESEAEFTEEQLDERISVFANQFQGKTIEEPQQENLLGGIPNSVLYMTGAGLVLIILALIFFMFRSRSKAKQEALEEEELLADLARSEEQTAMANTQSKETQLPDDPVELEDYLIKQGLTAEQAKRKSLEKLAMDNPEQFVKLVRTWMMQD
jgi:flagellar M-ring protein FliF